MGHTKSLVSGNGKRQVRGESAQLWPEALSSDRHCGIFETRDQLLPLFTLFSLSGGLRLCCRQI